MTMTPEGQAALMEDPEAVVRAHSEIDTAQVTGLGMYAVLGQYDDVAIIEVPDNKSLRSASPFGCCPRRLPFRQLCFS
jgi:uncharacterized protein with GYD domain